MVSIIVAVARNNAIGFENKLLYRLPNDLKRFKALTTGHAIVMGRLTFESLPKGALPNRRNMVLSRSCTSFEGAECFRSLQEALSACDSTDEVFVIGGASLYAEAMAIADRLYLTLVDDTPSQADAFFPAIDTTWEEIWREQHSTDEKHAHAYTFLIYQRNNH